MRGLLQGYPKQLGSVWITRPYPSLGTGVINRMALPDITEKGMGGMLIDQFVVNSNSTDVSVGNIWNGCAEVTIHDDYYPELAYLRPVKEAKGMFFSMCFTLNSLEYDK